MSNNYDEDTEYLQHKIKSYQDRLLLARESHIINTAENKLRDLVGDSSKGGLVQLPYQAVCALIEEAVAQALEPIDGPCEHRKSGCVDCLAATTTEVYLNGVVTKLPSATISFEQISALAERYPGEHLTIVYHHKDGTSGSLCFGESVTCWSGTRISAINTGNA